MLIVVRKLNSHSKQLIITNAILSIFDNIASHPRFSNLIQHRNFSSFPTNSNTSENVEYTKSKQVRRRVVVTGFGAMTPLGVGALYSFNQVLAGVSGLSRVTDKGTLHFNIEIVTGAPNYSDRFHLCFQMFALSFDSFLFFLTGY